MLQTLKQIARTLRQRLAFYTALYQDARTPRLARLLLWAALAYAALPFDLIPDFLPIIGHLDDVIIVPGLIFLAIRLLPVAVYNEHWQRTFGMTEAPQQESYH
ncbi:MAG: YkvA family protein [Candidatus Binatia bacterium]